MKGRYLTQAACVVRLKTVGGNAAERLVSTSLDEVPDLDSEDIARELELPEGTLAMAPLAVQAAHAAVEAWKRQNRERGPGTGDRGRAEPVKGSAA